MRRICSALHGTSCLAVEVCVELKFPIRRAGLDNTPPKEVMPNLSRLAEGLELVRAALGNHPIHVSSGYRSPRLNQMIGGAKNSMDTLGLAADILCPAFGPPLQVCRAIASSGIVIDQVIHEFGRWCHVSFALDGHAARNELLTLANAATGYELGLRNV